MTISSASSNLIGESLADPITGNCPLITLDGRTTASPRSNGPFMVTGVIRTLK